VKVKNERSYTSLSPCAFPCTQGQLYHLLATVLSLITLQIFFLNFIPWGREAAIGKSVSKGPGFKKKNIFWKVYRV